MTQKKLIKILRIVGYIICGLQIIFSGLAVFMSIKLKTFPTMYIIVAGSLLLILAILFIILQKWQIPGIITKFLSLILSAILVFGCFYMNYTYKRLSDMSGVKTQIDSIGVYVLADNVADDVKDLSGYTFGILQNLDRENTEEAIKKIDEEVGEMIDTSEAADVVALVDSLYNGEVGAIILNGAYTGFVTSTSGYEDFNDKVKLIWTYDIEKEVKTEAEHDDYLKNTDKIFSIYVNGVDTRGKAITNSNSDVNIILTVNMNTRQILMINTPRDYYVPLSISNGACDKLTHSGAYGIDVSIETLEMLYGVNVDNYVRINFAGFIDIVDELGGIDVHSDYDFTAPIADGETAVYSYNVGNNHLDGKQALAFARARHAFSDGDRQRGKNQMAVIEGVIDKLVSSELLKNYTGIWDKVSENIVTSMPYDDIADLVKFQLEDNRGWEIIKYSVNGTDAMASTYSAGGTELYVMMPDQATIDQAKQMLKDIYEGKKISAPAETPAQ